MSKAFLSPYQNACVKVRCMNNATCQTGFTDRGYRCVCAAGFEGEDCERGETRGNNGSNDCNVIVEAP